MIIKRFLLFPLFTLFLAPPISSSCEEEQLYEKPKTLLSFDGGGIRGLLSLYLVEELERHLGEPIAPFIDCFAGTSTGSIIASGYAYGLTTAELISYYENHSKSLFSSSV